MIFGMLNPENIWHW